jgi:hypothetical protein
VGAARSAALAVKDTCTGKSPTATGTPVMAKDGTLSARALEALPAASTATIHTCALPPR